VAHEFKSLYDLIPSLSLSLSFSFAIVRLLRSVICHVCEFEADHAITLLRLNGRS